MLRVAVLADEPPLSFVDPTTRQEVGYEIDVARAIAAHIGVRASFVPTLLAKRLDVLRSGAVDVVLAQLSVTPKRAAQIDFSLPYFRSGLRLLVRREDSDRVEDYGRARIGADRGSTQEDYLAADFRSAEIILFDDARQALQALRDGKIAGVLQDGVVLAGLLRGAADRASLKVLADSVTDESIAVGIRNEENGLLDHVNTALLDLEQSGAAKTLYHQWFDELGGDFATRNFAIEVQCGALSGWTRVDCPAPP